VPGHDERRPHCDEHDDDVNEDRDAGSQQDRHRLRLESEGKPRPHGLGITIRVHGSQRPPFAPAMHRMT
jgi:hypothetical protein